MQRGGSSAEGCEASCGAGPSNIEAEAEGAPSVFGLEKRRLRGEFNCWFPLLEVGGGERGHSQTLLRGNDHWVQKGRFWLYIYEKTTFIIVGEALEEVLGEALASEQPDLALKLAPHC